MGIFFRSREEPLVLLLSEPLEKRLTLITEFQVTLL
jgi:hypothetical protein